MALGKFHLILQAVKCWSDSHLHQFILGRMYYGVPHPDYMFQMKNEKNGKIKPSGFWRKDQMFVGKAPVLLKIAVESLAITVFKKQFRIPIVPNINICLNGGSFDPEAFDLDEINRVLKKIR